MAKLDRVVVIVKPDGVERGLTGEIISRLERLGLKLVALKMVWASEELVKKHYPFEREEFLRGMGEKTLKTYKEYGKDPRKVFGTNDPLEIGKMINAWNMDFFTSGPVVAMLLEGYHAVDNARSAAGTTMPVAAVPGSIRGDLATDSAAYANEQKRAVKNLVHVSGSDAEAKYEENIWFKSDEIHSYRRAGEDED